MQNTANYGIMYGDTSDPTQLSSNLSLLAQSVDDALVDINGPTAVNQSTTIAVPSVSPGWSGSIELVRHGRLVQLTAEFSGFWNNNTWNNNPGVLLPSLYAPAETIVLAGIYFIPSTGVPTGSAIPAKMQVLPSGSMLIGVGTISGNTGVRLSGMWFAGN